MAASPKVFAADTAAVPAAPASRTTIVVKADPRTGRLVRSVRDDSAPAKAKSQRPSQRPSQEISDIVDQAARAQHVDPLLVHSMIKTESNYNAYAISNKGAEGLMQLMPPTARMLGVTNSFDPRENIEAGVKYLKYLQGVFKDDRLALAAYNAGPGAVEKYKQVPPFKETQNYVDQIGKRYEDARRTRDTEVAKAAPDSAKASAQNTRPAVDPALPDPQMPPFQVIETHHKLEQFVDEHGRLSFRTVE
jgi:soluble lytic murein transglycosylase-like protein